MKITVDEQKHIQLEEVFNPIVLKTNDNETLVITMRDSGFELIYYDTPLSVWKYIQLKNGKII